MVRIWDDKPDTPPEPLTRRDALLVACIPGLFLLGALIEGLLLR